jgi:colanic acid/amylovoran biosynthesis glycosyltransferase
MLTVAYLANQFPSSVEPYVEEEIAELRNRGIRVIAGTVRTPKHGDEVPEIVLQSITAGLLGKAFLLCLLNWKRILPLLARVAFCGHESAWQRCKALLHTWLGACYALALRDKNVDHIHSHHGYFGSWIAMTAARLLNVGFSMTLHGSDLLLNGTYLDVKLSNCTFCLTVSEYNRAYILKRFPDLDSRKILVSRLGTEVPEKFKPAAGKPNDEFIQLLAVGRLHRVKNYTFLLKVCRTMLAQGLPFHCRIAGEGPERAQLESLIEIWGLQQHVVLLGHIPRGDLPSLYDEADVVVLTSHSEGIPLALMEAMARGRIVLAPAITGIPELVKPRETGLLYKPGSVRDCLAQLQCIASLGKSPAAGEGESFPGRSPAGLNLRQIRGRAMRHVRENFERKKNLRAFGDRFVERISTNYPSRDDADLILQQI